MILCIPMFGGSRTIQPTYPDDIFFADQNNGWISNSYPSDDSQALPSETVINFAFTTDSGSTWKTSSSFDFNESIRKNQISEYQLFSDGIGFQTSLFSWKTLNFGLDFTKIKNPNNGRLKFINELQGVSYHSKSIQFTQDSAENWTTGNLPSYADNSSDVRRNLSSYFINLNLGFLASQRLTFFPTSYIHEIYKTTDMTSNWNRTFQMIETSNPSTGYKSISSFYFINSTIGWAFGNRTLLVTSDSGNNWSDISTYFADLSIVYLKFTTASVGYALTTTTNKPYVLSKTIDGGVNWTEVNVQGIKISKIFILDSNHIWFSDSSQSSYFYYTADEFRNIQKIFHPLRSLKINTGSQICGI